MRAQINHLALRESQTPNCGGCTLCCKLLWIKAPNSPPNEWCKHCEPGIGCKIYNDRPEACRGYNCSWVLLAAKPSLRPDRCKAIWEPINERVMLAIHHPNYEIKEITHQQIKEFLKQKISVFLTYLDGKTNLIFLAKGHLGKEVRQAVIKRYNELHYDTTELHN